MSGHAATNHLEMLACPCLRAAAAAQRQPPLARVIAQRCVEMGCVTSIAANHLPTAGLTALRSGVETACVVVRFGACRRMHACGMLWDLATTVWPAVGSSHAVSEREDTCAVDCCPKPACGDGVCQAYGGENCLTCPQDCAGSHEVTEHMSEQSHACTIRFFSHACC